MYNLYLSIFKSFTFQPPQEATTWNGTRDATSDLPSCYQQNEDGEVVGQEDCLYLNVYTPEVSIQ